MSMKEAYTASQITEFFGKTERAIRDRAKREGWQSRPRSGQGGGNEWLVASMPEETRLALQTAVQRQELDAARAEQAHSAALVPLVPEIVRRGHLPALRDVTPLALPAPITTPAILDDRRRYRALAKADLVRLYLGWQKKHGATVHQKQTLSTPFLAAHGQSSLPN